MPHPTLTAEEIARRGEEIYTRDLRARLATEENRGKFLIIDITTGAYEIDREDLAATERLPWHVIRTPSPMDYVSAMQPPMNWAGICQVTCGD